MTIEEELNALRSAYGNALNDLKHAKENLQKAEQALFDMSSLILAVADTIRANRVDQKGTGGSGGSYKG